MSFKMYKEKIDEGDTVILYMSNNLYALDVQTEIKNKKGEKVENVFQTPYGALKVRTLIGADYGGRVELSKGWGHVLQPTPELWSLTLPHRTQIIYTPDISMIMLQLDLVPGYTVIEAGTGSGSLTHALIRRVRPHGYVYTFDFHEHRSNVAREEFASHGLGDFVTAQHRDVLADGFGDDLNGKADAVFLDLPSPWIGVPHSVAAIKERGGRFCSFSPCIEQVQRTCLALQEHGFTEVSTMEVLQTELKVNRRTIPVRDLSFLKHKVLCAISFLATGSYQRIVGITHHLPQRTTSRCIRQVVDALNHPAIVGKWIVFPKTRQARGGIKQEFQRRFGLPGVIGCIDCTHVALVKPDNEEHLFYNRKGYHSLNVQMSSESPVEEKPSSETSYAVGAWPPSTPGHTGYLTVASLPPVYARRKVKKTVESNEEKPLEVSASIDE